MAEKIRSAEELRMSALQKHLDEMDLDEKSREKAKQELAGFARDCLGKHVSEDEIAVINRR